MISARSLGVYVPQHPTNPHLPFVARTPRRLYRQPSGLREFVPARLNPYPQLPGSAGVGDFVRAGLNILPQLPGSAGIGCRSCQGGMGDVSSMITNVETDFSSMMAGTAPWTTYAMYGGIIVGGVFLLSNLSGGGGGRHRR